MRIGIYGGSFNPIHIGHTSLAQSLIKQQIVDEVWLLVSPLNPLKQSSNPDILDYEERLHIARLATKGIQGIHVSDFESSLPIPSYTVTTLNELTKTYPQHTFCLIIGADNWQDFRKWYKWEEILASYPIVIYRRPGYDLDTTSETFLSAKSITIADTPLYPISSTEIRQAIRLGQIPTEWLAPEVVKYIIDKGLYAMDKPD